MLSTFPRGLLFIRNSLGTGQLGSSFSEMTFFASPNATVTLLYLLALLCNIFNHLVSHQ